MYIFSKINFSLPYQNYITFLFFFLFYIKFSLKAGEGPNIERYLLIIDCQVNQKFFFFFLEQLLGLTKWFFLGGKNK